MKTHKNKPEGKNLLGKVKAAIDREHLVPDGIRTVVGISGGADSVALLHILHRLGYNIAAAHLNHSIRGKDANADEAFVKTLCEKLDVECTTTKTDVPALAKEKKISIEMAAREARHRLFRSITSSLKHQTSPAPIALAHHADDQLETFFLRAARGSSSAGLGGMKPFQPLENLTLIRPMLGIRRAEILQWLEKEGLDWREDASNENEAIPRNSIRHQILPTLGKINDRAAENILRTMETLRADEETQATRIVARNQLIRFGVNPTYKAVEQFIAFSARTEGTTHLDLEGIRITNEYGKMNVGQVSSQFCRETMRMKKGIGILYKKNEASISLEKIGGRKIIIRTPRPGDRMKPYGMTGSKKLHDIFIDLKTPKAQRAEFPVVECGGEIIWLPGYRIARGWELSSSSEPALHIFA